MMSGHYSIGVMSSRNASHKNPHSLADSGYVETHTQRPIDGSSSQWMITLRRNVNCQTCNMFNGDFKAVSRSRLFARGPTSLNNARRWCLLNESASKKQNKAKDTASPA